MLSFEELPQVNSERWLSLTDLPEEEWRDIQGYEGKYQVSCYGRVKSLERERIVSGNSTTTQKPRILKSVLRRQKSGYWYVSFHNKSNSPTVKKDIHRLVALHFVENPNRYNVINHKDENTNNNTSVNLEWCTYAYNNSYGTALSRSQETRYRKGIMNPVGEYEDDGRLLFVSKSLREMADHIGTNKGTLRYYCKNKKQYKNGKFYKYINRDERHENFRRWA